MLSRYMKYALIVVFTASMQSFSVFAGSLEATGIVEYQQTSNSDIWAAVLSRHKLGLEYGWKNREFQRLLEDVVFDYVLESGIPSSRGRAIISSLNNQVDRIAYANKNGIDFIFVNRSFRELLEVFLVSVTPEGTSEALTAAKLVTAFMTGYIYGFLAGR